MLRFKGLYRESIDALDLNMPRLGLTEGCHKGLTPR